MGGLVIGADLPLFKCSPFIMSGKSFQIWKTPFKNAGRCFGEFKNSTSSSSLTFTQSSSFFTPIISTDTIDMT